MIPRHFGVVSETSSLLCTSGLPDVSCSIERRGVQSSQKDKYHGMLFIKHKLAAPL